MKDNSPVTAYSGVKHFAVAESYYNWSYNLGHVDERCTISSHRVAVDMLYVMPRWIDKERGGKRLVKYWEQFEQNLWVHERGHGDIALAIGVELAKTIGETPPADDCAALKEDINARAKASLKELSGKQREYDRLTAHGARQGAFFNVRDAK